MSSRIATGYALLRLRLVPPFDNKYVRRDAMTNRDNGAMTGKSYVYAFDKIAIIKRGCKMCTAISFQTKDFYFGRTLDHTCSYGEEVTLTPRKFPFKFLREGEDREHYAIIGMAHVAENYPLYYDAVNEKGLAVAGLNFTESACYGSHGKQIQIAQFELIPFLLGRCSTVREAVSYLKQIDLLNEPFGQFPLARLHWLVSDKTESVTVEPMREGIKIYKNPWGVLTNEPPFPMQTFALRNYMGLSPKTPRNRFAKGQKLRPYGAGMGTVGLPGDYSPMSRFVRAAYVKSNIVSSEDEKDSVGQFFHILGAVEQPRGCSETTDGKFETTVYTSCCNADKGIYYYTVYGNRQITAVDMHREDLSGTALRRFPVGQEEQIRFLN